MRTWSPAVVVFLSACGPRGGPAVHPPPPDANGPLTPALLEWLVAEVAPHVEAAAGREFTEIPFAGIGTADTLARLVEEDSRVVYAAMYPDLDRESVRQLAATQPVDTLGIVGKYAPRGGTLYMVPAAVDHAVQAGQIAQDQRGDYVRLVLAHELTHALQDQHTDTLARLSACADIEALQAYQGVIEGHAMWVEEQVASRLGLSDLYWASVTGQGWGRDGLEDPGAWSLWATYGQGRAFMEWHYEDGGTDRQWAILADPPRTTTPVFRPERWGDEREAPDLREVLDGVEQHLTRGAWLAQTARVGEASLRVQAWGSPGALEAMDGLEGWQRVAARSDRSVEVSVVRAADHAGACAWQAALVASGDLRGDGLGDRWSVTTSPMTAPAGAWAWVGGPAGDRPSSSEVWVGVVTRGDLVVRAEATGFRPGLRLSGTLEAILEQLPEGPACADGSEEG